MKRFAIIALLLAMITPVVCAQNSAEDNQRFWKKGNKELRIGYTFASLDKGASYGGEIDGRVGVSLDIMRNIYLHRGAIGGFLKIGLQFGPQLTYVNFEKGHGSIKDALGGGDEEKDEDLTLNLGSHQLMAGVGIGPTLTFMPFFRSNNSNLARLKFRAHFNVVPGYSAYITSDEDEVSFHNAFACMFAGGLNIQWRKLDVGFQYKGGRATYKDLVEEISNGMMGFDPFERTGKKPRFASNFYTINIGLVF